MWNIERRVVTTNGPMDRERYGDIKADIYIFIVIILTHIYCGDQWIREIWRYQG